MQFQQISNNVIKWLKEANYPQNTIKSYNIDITQFFDYLNIRKRTSVSNLTTKDMDNYLLNLTKHKYAPRSISRKINSLKILFKYLFEQKLIKENIVEDIKHPKFTQRNIRILKDRELSNLRDDLKDDLCYLTIVEVLLQTGMKIGECADLELNDLRLIPGKKFGEVRLNNSSNPRIIPMNNVLEKMITKYLAIRPNTKDCDVFVTKTGKGINERNIRKVITRYLKLAGINDVYVNDLRYTFIVKQLNKGVSLERVAYLVGYKSITSMLKFVKSLKSELKIDTKQMVEVV